MAGYNPFLEAPDSGNPFVTLPSNARNRQQVYQEVEEALATHGRQPQPSTSASQHTVFGSPVSYQTEPQSRSSAGSVPDSPALMGAWGSRKTRPAAFEVSSDTPSSRIGVGAGSSYLNGSESTAKDAQVAKREQELRRREEAVTRREVEVRAAVGRGQVSSKNWPRCFPLLHHDIAGDIPSDNARLVKMHYYTWMVVATGYIFNFIIMTIFWGSGEKGVDMWLMSGIVAFTGLPLSFFCWYRQFYRIAINDGNVRWVWYFLNMLTNVVWCWWIFIGIRPKIGGYSAGLFTLIQQFGRNSNQGVAFGVLCIINMVLFGVGGAFSIVLLGKAFRKFRGRENVTVVRTSAATRIHSWV